MVFLFVRERIHGQMAGVTPVNGRITTCMDSECILGQMEEGMKENTSMTRNMDSANTYGLMAGSILGIGISVSNMGKGGMSYQMDRNE